MEEMKSLKEAVANLKKSLKISTATSTYDTIELANILDKDGVRLLDGIEENPFFKITASEYMQRFKDCESCITPATCKFKGNRMSVREDGSPFYYPCEDYAGWEERECMRKVTESNRLPQSHASKSLESYIVDTVHQGKALFYMKELAKLPHGGVGQNGAFLFGDTGQGKTHLAVGLLKQQAENGSICMFTVVPELMDQLRECYRNNISEREIMEALHKCDVLVLDDLGVERPTEWVAEKLYSIINTRYLYGLCTIITSNYSLTELEGRLGVSGKRITSRLLEMCKLIPLHGSDYRLKIAKGH